MQINGIAHIQLSVTNLQVSRAFYKKLFDLFEMKVIFDDDTAFYGVGGRTGVALSPVDEAHKEDRFVQRRVGLHHLCFRLRAREDVDTLYTYLLEMGAKIIHAPENGPWAEGYYSVLFEDPDGIRLEANFVPGKGNLDPAVQLPKPVPQV
ncbi:MAG: VOC family protein [Polyangiaceae bacterium]|nr:VOC family protein [Polyangiaceae bacterium]